MEIILILLVVLFIVAIVLPLVVVSRSPSKSSSPYSYYRKQGIMTATEASFYKRLVYITKDRYLVFPQIHLSSLAVNNTQGSYRRSGFLRLNHRSIDYVLVDPETLSAVYAIELDDHTHDSDKGRSDDAFKNDFFQQIHLPLVRFRNHQELSDDDIIQALANARLDINQ